MDASCVSFDELHCIIYQDKTQTRDKLDTIAEHIAKKSIFPHGADVDFTNVQDKHHVNAKS